MPSPPSVGLPSSPEDSSKPILLPQCPKLSGYSANKKGCFPQPDKSVFPGFGGLYLRGHKVRCVAWGHEQPVLGSQLLGKPEVTDADGFRVSRLVHVQNVTWFQVPMNNLEGRTMSQS